MKVSTRHIDIDGIADLTSLEATKVTLYWDGTQWVPIHVRLAMPEKEGGAKGEQSWRYECT